MLRITLSISLAFLFLVLSLGLLLTNYWHSELEPRLYREARSHADILAQAQAERLADAISAPGSGVSDLTENLEEILAFRDPETSTPFFARIALDLDPEVVTTLTDVLDLKHGSACPDCFEVEVPLFESNSYELLGLARFWVSNRFFRALTRDMRRALVTQSVFGLILLGLVWISVLVLVFQLRRQTSERQLAERALLRNQQRYQRLLDNLPNYFVYARAPGESFSFASDSVRQVLGYSPEEVCSGFDRCLAEVPSNQVSRARIGSRSPEEQGPYEIVFRSRDGRLRYIECAEKTLFEADGAEPVIEGIARDVTEHRKLEGALKLAKERAESANRAKSQFLANVSHEIRTPMNAIMGLTSLALKTSLSPKQRDYLSKVDLSAHALLAIINDILDISKMESGRMELESIDFLLDEVLQRLIDTLALKAEEKHLEVAVAVDQSVPHCLNGDPLRLGQVLLNLTNNAIKFTEKGEVLVGVRPAGVSSATQIDLEFYVRDTGIGIDPKTIPTLFQPFTQSDGSTMRIYGGTGLGLAISKHLVEMMQGRIQVESAPGSGSTFRFTARFRHPQRPKALPWVLPEGLRDMPVLVVDDSILSRETLRNALSGFSFAVETADRGDTAIRILEQAERAGRPFRLVLLDWKMPGLDGVETARRLRRNPEIKEQPALLLVTAHSQEHPLQDAQCPDFAGLLAKPVSQSSLFDAILTALGKGKAAASQAGRHGRASTTRFPPGIQLLVVEDNAINRQVAFEMLTAAGFLAQLASNGAEALDALEDGQFAAVLIDLQMPVMDGFETTRRLREKPRFSSLPIIAMTAHAMAGDAERCLKAGMNGHVSKPVDEEKLFRELARWIQPLPDAQAGDGSQGGSGTRERTGNQVPGIDSDKALRQASGNSELALRLYREFVTTNVDTSDRIRKALEAGGRADAGGIAHALKGEAGAVGAYRIAAAARAMELAIRDESALGPVLDELEAALEQVIRSATGIRGNAGSLQSPDVPDVLDAEKAVALLDRLVVRLEAQNLAAKDTFGELCALAGMGGCRQELESIGGAVERLDFAQALEYAHTLSERLRAQLR